MATASARAVQPPHFDLPPLPYPEDALEPVISRETLGLHHGKHHKKYVDTMNELLQKEPIQARTLEDVVRQAKGKLFNNAGQAWNHDFYWKSLSPARQRPSGALAKRIDADFGSYERFVEQGGKLQIQTTANAETPWTTKGGAAASHGIKCLLTIDVWEHAYYVDYRNQRDRYLAQVIGERLNWKFVEQNLG